MKIKKKILDILQVNQEKGCSREQLAQQLSIQQQDRQLFYAALAQMEQEGFIQQKPNGIYVCVEPTTLDTGIMRSHKKGFGFITVDGEAEDFFVRPQDMGGALDGDVVNFQKIKDPLYPDRDAAKVVSIKMRANHRQVGTVVSTEEPKYFAVALDNSSYKGKVLVTKKNNSKLVIGHKVVVTPEEYPEDGVIIARVDEILGHENTPGIDILSIVKQYDIPVTFSDAVLKEVKKIPSEVTDADLAGREDLRDQLTITIDGADAKDLDDAISLEKRSNGHYLLSVHIADVSYYVKRGTAIDQEALIRGTSVYLADRVIPMLPVQLSNGICSLHPHVARLTLTAAMEIDLHGRIVAKQIFPSVIRSDERMTYSEVNKLLKSSDKRLSKRYAAVYPMLKMMKKLAHILEEQRHEQGALDFSIDEPKIIVNKQGKAIDIKVRKQDMAEKIIEQFMVVANEAIADYFSQEDLPFIYRVHGNPQDVKLDAFRQVAANMGIGIHKIKNTASVKPKALQQILEKINEKSDYDLLSTLLLRTMQKAEYSTNNIGHFGLAMYNYTHFTSPIRRYPDLIVHRLLRHYLFTGKGDKLEDEEVRVYLQDIAQQTSVAERRAIECERAVTRMKMAEYMEEHLGETYTGVINGVISSGFFVELDNLVEGKVGLESLKDDYYIFMPDKLMLFGRRTKKTFRMGDKVKIKVESASKATSEINFSIVGTPSVHKKRSQSKKKTTTKQHSPKQKMSGHKRKARKTADKS